MAEKPTLAVVLTSGQDPRQLFEAARSWCDLRHWCQLQLILVTGHGVALPDDLADLATVLDVERPPNWNGCLDDLRRQAGFAEAVALETDAIAIGDVAVRALSASVFRVAHWLRYEMHATPVLAGFLKSKSDAGKLLSQFTQHSGFQRPLDFSRHSCTLNQHHATHAGNLPSPAVLVLNRRAALALSDDRFACGPCSACLEGHTMVQRLLLAGQPVHCDNEFFVNGMQRSGLASFCTDWACKGWAAAEFRRLFGKSAFGRRRAWHAWLIAGLAAATGISAVIAPLGTALAVATAAIVVGLWSVWTSRRWIAIAFGGPLCLAGLAFTAGFFWFTARGGKMGAREDRLFSAL